MIHVIPFLRSVVNTLVLTALIPYSQGQNHRVYAGNEEGGDVSAQTAPMQARYIVIDLGTTHQPKRVTNSGRILLRKNHLEGSRWYNRQLEQLSGGDLADMNEAGTAVGNAFTTNGYQAQPLIRRPTQPFGTTLTPLEWPKPLPSTQQGVKWEAGQVNPGIVASPSTPFFLQFETSEGFSGETAGYLNSRYTSWSAGSTNSNGTFNGVGRFRWSHEGNVIQSHVGIIDDDGSIFGSAIPAGGVKCVPDSSDYYTVRDGFQFPGGQLGSRTLTKSVTSSGWNVTGQGGGVSHARAGIRITGAGGVATVNGFQVSSNARMNNAGGVYDGSTYIPPSGPPRNIPLINAWRYYQTFNGFNHRILTTTDASGAIVTRPSPMFVGELYASWGYTSSSGVIVEEDPNTGIHQIVHMDALLGGNSPWEIDYLYAINDNGWIVGQGWHAPRDATGKVIGIRKWKSVLLLPIEISFQPIGNNEPITDNMSISGAAKGKRVFPDRKVPNETTQRNRVFVRVKVGTPNMQVTLKAFDVDDPTSDTTIDPNDSTTLGVGDDNRTAAVGNGSTHAEPKPPFFVVNNSTTLTCTTNSEGIAVIANGTLPAMEVGWQPGDNYRVAVAVSNPSQLESLQVSSPSAAGYIAGDSNQQPSSFNGLVSPMLTTWRRLHIEVDTMTKWQGNKPSPDRTTATGTSWATEGNRRSTVTLSAALPKGADFYAGGFIKSGATQFDITNNTTTSITIHNPGGTTPPSQLELNGFIGQTFEVHDDDDRGSGNSILDMLPQANVINADVKKAYARAYIEIEEVPHSAEFNANPTIPFELNSGTLVNPFTSLDDSQNMGGADRKEYWYTLLVVAYQYTEGKDSDPTGEPIFRGLTVGQSPVYPRFSSIYVEGIRESAFVATGVHEDVGAIFRRDMWRVVAHEIGHACGNGNDPDHEEGDLMGDDAASNEFTPTTIFRFRSAPLWQK